MTTFKIQGQHALHGEIGISGSKNAALPIIAACLLTKEPCILNNVPDISDVHTMLEILETLGAKTAFKNHQVFIEAKEITQTDVHHEQVGKLRASILVLGPLLARAGEAKMAFPGGCVLGKRSVHAHTHALKKLGAEVIDDQAELYLKSPKPKSASIIMSEASVTATENAIMMAVLAKGATEIRWAAMEPHVQDLCRFLNKMGAKIEGIGTHTLKIKGVSELHGTNHDIISDYLETGTLALAAVLTRGEVTLTDCDPEHLDSFWQKLEEVGAKFELGKDFVKILPAGDFKAIEKLRTAVYPGFATDLQAPFSVLLTQAEGESRIYETLFEGRLNYLYELQKMGAQIEIINKDEAIIKGATELEGVEIASCDIRAGAAMVLAALIAKGETEISNIYYIDRGYEKIDEKLRSLGAKITRETAK